MQWIVDDPRNERAAVAAVAALGEGGTLHRGPIATAPAAELRFAFASDLAGLPVGTSRQTILVNAERFEVLELLEAHDLGGAIECVEHDAWAAAGARMFVRRDAIDLARGTVIDGAGRESEHFVLWSQPGTLAELVRTYAAALRTRADAHEKLVITAAECTSHALPPVGMTMIVDQIGMMPFPFPRAGWYLQFESPPGGMQVFDVRACSELAPEALVQESFAARDQTVRFIGTEQVQLAGGTRLAALCETGGDNSHMRMGWALVPIQHAHGHLTVRIATRLAVGKAPSWQQLLRFRGHQILTASFTLQEA